MLNHLDQTLEDLEALNTYIEPEMLRQFQYLLASDGTFSLRSPLDGRALDCAEHWLLPLNDQPGQLALPLHLYRFKDAHDLWLASFQIGLGHPLCALIVEGVYAHYSPQRHDPHQPMKVLRRLQNKVDTLHTLEPSENPIGTPSVWIGHPNFAHVMWNEIPALRALYGRLNGAPELRCLFAPLGQLGGAEPVEPLTPVRRRAPPFPTPVGGELLDAESAAWINGQIRDQAKLQKTFGPAIWVAHREDGRACLNFETFFRHFDARCRELFCPTYILDSFSLPADFSAARYDPLRRSFEDRVEQATYIFERLKACVAPEGRKSVHTSAGLDAPSAMAMARQADFYISPIGSIQHKVAWLQPIDGVVHGPASASVASVARWHGLKSEIARAPQFIPSDLIEDTAPSKAHLPASRNMDYRFTDPEAAAEIAFQACLKTWRTIAPG